MAEFKLTDEEWKKIGQESARQAIQEAKAAGVPFTYMIGDKVIREYPDGKKVKVTFNEQGQAKEIDYAESSRR